jgi:hypothetical protein
MAQKNHGERLTAVEVSLRTHLQSCEKKHNRNFVALMALVTLVASVFVKLQWFLP